MKRSTSDRGYGALHQRARDRIAPKVAAGGVICWRCGEPILPWQEWDLGHDDADRGVYRGPEHRGENRSAGALKGNALRRAAKAAVTRLRW